MLAGGGSALARAVSGIGRRLDRFGLGLRLRLCLRERIGRRLRHEQRALLAAAGQHQDGAAKGQGGAATGKRRM
ncbi:hypothetical protein Hsero_0190 [Herbaspirillum seropedicae SmR1]|uniref:Uncharacterized protein n=1 Tax=Herbaspirillum seropedicae (strain SmR1) TaxID=757424 RepID=D8IUZ7_HERSS|nr:hypothetical protein Hsero_0190 [Herbaspirillum seropedicae SmR1]